MFLKCRAPIATGEGVYLSVPVATGEGVYLRALVAAGEGGASRRRKMVRKISHPFSPSSLSPQPAATSPAQPSTHRHGALRPLNPQPTAQFSPRVRIPAIYSLSF